MAAPWRRWGTKRRAAACSGWRGRCCVSAGFERDLFIAFCNSFRKALGVADTAAIVRYSVQPGRAMYRAIRHLVGGMLVTLAAACGEGRLESEPSRAAGLTFDGADATTDDGLLQHGERLSTVLGCTGCHQEDFSGGPFNEGWIAPNLSLAIAEYDTDALDRAIRQGIAVDDRKIRMMPSEMYQWLSDADFQALEMYVRALEPVGNVQPAFAPFPADIAQWAADGYTNAHDLGVSWAQSQGPLSMGAEHARGRYLAITLCTECHNNRLQGYPGFTPDLSVIRGYGDTALERLLHEGKGNARDELGLMSLVSPARFPHLTDREYDDLTAYLRARAQALVEE